MIIKMKECDNVTSQHKLKPSNGGYTEQGTPPNRGKHKIFIINKLPNNQEKYRKPLQNENLVEDYHLNVYLRRD